MNRARTIFGGLLAGGAIVCTMHASAAPPAKPPIPAPATAAAPAAAPADEPRSLSDVLSGDAKTQYDIARILYRDGDHAGALAKFRRAYDISHDARLLWNMAACEKNLRHYARVLGLVDQYVKDGNLPADDLERARKFSAAVRTLVGDVKVVLDEPGATVTIDDEQAGTTPLEKPILVDMGRRKLRVAKAGFRPFERAIDVEGGVEQSVTVALEREMGRVVVKARAADSILVDGKAVGHGSWAGALAAGPHVLVASAPSGKSRRSEVVIADRETRELTLETEGDGIPKWVFWAGAGVLVAGAAVGGYFLFRPKADEPPSGTIGAYQVP